MHDPFSCGGSAADQTFDWPRTALGPYCRWPQSAKTAADIVLAHPLPALLLWGDDAVLVGNEALFRRIDAAPDQVLGRAVAGGSLGRLELDPASLDCARRGERVTQRDCLRSEQHAPGRARPVLDAHYVPVRDEAGGVGGVLMLLLDADAERQARSLAHAREAERKAVDRASSMRVQFEVVAGNTSDACIVYDAAFRFSYLNAAAERYLGRPRGTLLGRALWDVFPELVDNPSSHSVLKCMRDRVPVHWEGYVALADAWSEAHMVPVPDGGLVALVRTLEGRDRVGDMLILSERRFRTLADLVPALIWTSDADGGTFWCNRRYAEYTGLTPERAASFEARRLLHPEDQAEATTQLEHSTRLRQAFRRELRLRAADGSYRWFVVHAQPVFDAVGVVIHWVGVATDIQSLRDALRSESAARAEAEAARADAEAARARITRVLASAPFAVAMVSGPEHVLVSVNHMAERIVGPRGLTGRPMRDAFPEPEAAGLHAMLDRAYFNGQTIVLREQPVGWDRTGRGVVELGHFDVVYQPILDARDTVEGVLVFGVEVTHSVVSRAAVVEARDLAEQACGLAEHTREFLSRILATVPAAIAVTRGPDHVYELVNPAFQRMLGDRGRAVWGRAFGQVLPEFQAAEYDHLRERIAAGEQLTLSELHVSIPQKTPGAPAFEGFLNVHCQPLRDDFGEVDCVVTVAVDVSEQVRQRQRIEVLRADAEAAKRELEQAHARLEERIAARTAELAAANKQLEAEIQERARAEQARQVLLRRLASAREDEQRRAARDLHDQVGQTLTALALTIQAARSAAFEPAVCARLGEVQRLVEQLGREVHDLAMRLRPMALDDFGLHAALQQLLREWSARYTVELDFQAGRLGQERLPADIETVSYRVIQEALTNVARHAHAQHVSVVLERHAGHAIVVVEDDGAGFDVDAIGSGRLGLVGMQERVSLVGGSLDIESEPGRGTTLIARLPIVLPAAHAEV